MSFLSIISMVVAVAVIVFLMYKIMKEIRDNYEDREEDPYVLSLVSEIRHIDPRVNKVVDNLKFYAGNRSYTINKKNVYLCKNDENNKLYDKNQLVLVLIHEISHALCDEIGHTDKFNQILDDLL
jgi:hypothetical protein